MGTGRNAVQVLPVIHVNSKSCIKAATCVGGTQSNLDTLATASAASKQQIFAMEAVKEVDRCITELASALPVDLMPGPGDLSNHALPQQPLHQCLFPGAAPCSNFHRVTNPYRFSIDGVHCLGTSGQNVHDIQR
jgi:DNA polymerase delta subunit 2